MKKRLFIYNKKIHSFIILEVEVDENNEMLKSCETHVNSVLSGKKWNRNDLEFELKAF